MNDIVQSRLQALAPEYRAVVESEFASTVASTLGQVHSFTTNQERVLTNAIQLYLLGLLTKNTFEEFISSECGLSTDEAAVLAAATLETIPTEIHTALEVPAPTPSDSQQTIARDIAETEAALQQLAQVRTMSRDMTVIQSGEDPVYRSNQDALLAEQSEIEEALAKMRTQVVPSPTPPAPPAKATTASVPPPAAVPPIPTKPPLPPIPPKASSSETPRPIPVKSTPAAPRWESETP